MGRRASSVACKPQATRRSRGGDSAGDGCDVGASGHRRQDLGVAWHFHLLARRGWGHVRLMFGCVSRECANAQNWKKKRKAKKKRKTGSLFQTPTKPPTSTGLMCRVCAWLRWGRAREAFRREASGGCVSIPCNGADTSTSGCKGAQGGTRVVRGGGQSARTCEKKNTTCLSCCACAADARAGGR